MNIRSTNRDNTPHYAYSQRSGNGGRQLAAPRPQAQGAGTTPMLRLKPEDLIKLAALIQLQQTQGANQANEAKTTGVANTKSAPSAARSPQQQSQQASSTEGYAAMWTSVIGGLLERFPDAGEALNSFITRNVGDLIRVNTAQATTNTIGGLATNSTTGAVGQAGFNSLDEMLSNGLFSAEAPSSMMTSSTQSVAGSGMQTATTSTMQTASNVMSGLAGLYSMYEGGTLVAQANKVGGLRGRQAGGMGGLTAAFGAGMAINALGLALGPVGWAGLLVGGVVAGGLLGSRLGDRDRWKTEGKRLSKLLEQGVQIPEELLGAMQMTRGRSKEELIDKRYAADFAGHTPHGFVNNKFANSRDEKDLHPEDIWGSAAFFEKFGNDWLGKFSEEQRRTIAQSALESGAVREKHGTIYVDWKPDLEEKIKSMK